MANDDEMRQPTLARSSVHDHSHRTKVRFIRHRNIDQEIADFDTFSRSPDIRIQKIGSLSSSNPRGNTTLNITFGVNFLERRIPDTVRATKCSWFVFEVPCESGCVEVLVLYSRLCVQVLFAPFCSPQLSAAAAVITTVYFFVGVVYTLAARYFRMSFKPRTRDVLCDPPHGWSYRLCR